MMHIDARSRNLVADVMLVEGSDSTSIAKFRRVQMDDDELNKILTTGDYEETDQYSIKNGLVYKDC